MAVSAHATPATPASPLAAARVRRRLTLEEAAARAKLDVEAVRSLEENRMYRFGSSAQALGAALVYAAALGISEREARRLAGLPTRPLVLQPGSLRRVLAVAAFTGACLALAYFAVRPERASQPAPAAATTVVRTAPAPLPPRWEIDVDVYNGTRVGNAAAGIANEVAGLAYRIGTVEDAERSDYVKTLVYYPPGGEAIAARLAEELGVATAALPGGDDPTRLVVVVGRDPR